MNRTRHRLAPFVAVNVTFLVSAAAAVLIYGFVIHGRNADNRDLCHSHLALLGLSFQQYCMDYDGRLPLVKCNPRPSHNGNYGWADAVNGYTMEQGILAFQCPSWPYHQDGDATGTGFTDYYFNRGLTTVKIGAVPLPAHTILSGDGIPSDARYARISPETAGDPPADTRHFGGANYVFVDGHVKWLPPGQVKPAGVLVSGSNYSFDGGAISSVTASAATNPKQVTP
jgi:prepilin-type processing-associated H-X9-DG protein